MKASLTLACFLDDVVERHGGRVAIRFEGRSIGYRELAAESRELARALLGAGVGKGTRVAVLIGNRPEWIVAFFAVGLAGGVLVPVNTFATPEERDYVLRHSDAALLLLQPSLLRRDFLAELRASHPELDRGAPGRLRCPALPHLRRVVALGAGATGGAIEAFEALLALGADVDGDLVDAAATAVDPSDDALVIYTSGTTAHPKGVLHAQRAPVIQSWRFAELMRLVPEDRVFTSQPFFWTAGIAMSLGATLAAGATLVLQETFEPGAALALIEAERVTAVHTWPHQEKALGEHPEAARRNLSSVRKTRISSPLARLAGLTKDEWGMDAAYGLSETFTLAAALPADAPAALRAACHGRALPGMTIRIVDPETGAPLPAGAPGEIAVKGATLMKGYTKVEPDLYLDPEGFFHTQDGGSLDEEGFLHWTGRLSNLIKTGGANVSPLEIEQALAAHPALRAALAVGVPHPTLGEAIVLCAVPREGVAPGEEELRAFLRSKLAAYKLPRRVFFFGPEELSYTGSQKIQTEPLRAAALARLEAERAEIAGFRYGGSA